MALIFADQVKYFPPVFEPDYITGSHGEINPLTGALYGAYGLTVIDARKRASEQYRLWDRTHSKGSAYANKQKFVPLPAPDLVEEFPPEDTRGIIAIVVLPETLALKSGVPYDLTFEVVLGNKTPTEMLVTIEARDLTFDEDTTLVLNQSQFLLPGGTEAVVMLAAKVPSTVVGRKTFQIYGENEANIMVQPTECVLDFQPNNPLPVFYQVSGPETYTLNIGDPVSLQFTTSNGMGETELWEFNDPWFLQAHNLTFDDSGILSSTGVTGPPGLYQVTVFVEQTTDFGTKLFSSKIIEILVT